MNLNSWQQHRLTPQRQCRLVRQSVALIALLWATLSNAQTAHLAADTSAPAAAAVSSKVDTQREAEIATVDIESTIRGNPEQPKTIYVLPWQESVARIKMNGDEPESTETADQPLDRDDFLRFINANQTTAGDSESPQSKQ